MTVMTSSSPATPGQPAAGRIALVAGGGHLPVAVATTLASKGLDPLVYLVEGEGADPSAYAHVEHVVAALEEFPQALDAMRARGVDRVVLAGSIARRIRLRRVRWTWKWLPMLPSLATALRGGDDALLRTVMAIFEARGMSVIAPHEIVPDLLAPRGCLTKTAPAKSDWRDIVAATEAALAIGRLDIGQAAVAVAGRAVALEGIEGTDGLLDRMKGLRGHGRLAGKTRGVLAKLCKPTQELRADLPSIGPETIVAAAAAGLAGIVVDASRAFVLDFERTVAVANEARIFVVGLTAEDIAKRSVPR